MPMFVSRISVVTLKCSICFITSFDRRLRYDHLRADVCSDKERRKDGWMDGGGKEGGEGKS